MHTVTLDLGNGVPLVEQIVTGIRADIAQRKLLAGAKLPSIRAFAAAHRISRFTVVEAYDRLVAQGQVLSRRGAGFYVRPIAEQPAPETNGAKRNEDLVWLIRRLLEDDGSRLLAGGPWLPNHWLDEAGIRRNLQVVARKAGATLLEYGNAFGYAPLRALLSVQLADISIAAQPAQILLTHGASQALDLIIRGLLRPGDAVLVDDPGYYNLFGNLRFQGARMLAVPRGPQGPDLETLEALAAEHRPKLYFTQSAMQNPTGTAIGPHQAFRLLQLAARFDFRIVEDDIFCDLQSRPAHRLATLDQLDRVIYVRSFSKTLSGSLRVGFLAAHAELVRDLADIKMLSAITTSQHMEQVLYTLLADGHYRKFLDRLRGRVDTARAQAVRVLTQAGFTLFAEPEAGMFLYARLPQFEDSLALAEHAATEGIMLAPGTLFRPDLGPSAWLRFNVAMLGNARLGDWLQRVSVRNSLGPVD